MKYYMRNSDYRRRSNTDEDIVMIYTAFGVCDGVRDMLSKLGLGFTVWGSTCLEMDNVSDVSILQMLCEPCNSAGGNEADFVIDIRSPK